MNNIYDEIPRYYELELSYQESKYNDLRNEKDNDEIWILNILIRESQIRAKYIDKKLHTKQLGLDEYLLACHQIEVQQPVEKLPSDHPRRSQTSFIQQNKLPKLITK